MEQKEGFNKIIRSLDFQKNIILWGQNKRFRRNKVYKKDLFGINRKTTEITIGPPLLKEKKSGMSDSI